MPSGRATKPGDVVTAMNGKTIQVTVVYLDQQTGALQAVHLLKSFSLEFSHIFLS